MDTVTVLFSRSIYICIAWLGLSLSYNDIVAIKVGSGYYHLRLLSLKSTLVLRGCSSVSSRVFKVLLLSYWIYISIVYTRWVWRSLQSINCGRAQKLRLLLLLLLVVNWGEELRDLCRTATAAVSRTSIGLTASAITALNSLFSCCCRSRSLKRPHTRLIQLISSDFVQWWANDHR